MTGCLFKSGPFFQWKMTKKWAIVTEIGDEMTKFRAEIPPDLRAQIEKLGRLQIAKPGERLLFQGEPASHIGFVLSGRAKAISFSADGTETWLGRFEAGEFFGHIAFLTESHVRFEVSAEEMMSIRLLPIDDVKTLMDTAPDMGGIFARDLANRLDMMMARLVEALTLSAKGRVSAELLRLSNPIGINPSMSVIRPNPIFVDMALRINSTRETVSRAISDLEKRGIIKREAGAIVIEKPEALKQSIR